jgi:hypothetical protein
MLKLPLALTVFLWGSVALATPEFPAAITNHLQLDYQPGCDVCHGSSQGGGPMAKPFGRALQQRGLSAGNTSSLYAALDKLKADGVDSNGNGSSDIDDLITGVDPNATGNQQLVNAPPPQYGCIGQVARTKPDNGASYWITGIVVGALAYSRVKSGPRNRRLLLTVPQKDA